MAKRLLSIYLRDHLAGATAGRELARRALANSEGTDLEPALSRLAGEIDEDREDLVRLMGELGIRPSRTKIALGWLAERAGRLKLNGRLVRSSPLSRLVELEGLTLGVSGKQCLWAGLERAGLRPEAVDLAALRERAGNQRRELEARRLEIAAEVLELHAPPEANRAPERPS
ncbi:MAG: hypothetical protein ACRDNC_05925 [Gaiellaceae bacterium]